MKNLKIQIGTVDGLRFFEASTDLYSLFAYSMTDLINQLWEIWQIDLRKYLFSPSKINNNNYQFSKN